MTLNFPTRQDLQFTSFKMAQWNRKISAMPYGRKTRVMWPLGDITKGLLNQGYPIAITKFSKNPKKSIKIDSRAAFRRDLNPTFIDFLWIFQIFLPRGRRVNGQDMIKFFCPFIILQMIQAALQNFRFVCQNGESGIMYHNCSVSATIVVLRGI